MPTTYATAFAAHHARGSTLRPPDTTFRRGDTMVHRPTMLRARDTMVHRPTMLRARDTTTTTNLQFSFLWAGFQRPTDMAGDDLSGRNWRNGGPQQPTMPVIVPAQICARRGAMAAKGTYEIGEARTASWRE